MPLQARFDAELRKHFDDGDHVLAAVSGGADSICLAELLVASNLVRFSIVHCNFHLRGDESDEDEAFVREWADRHGIMLHVENFDTTAYARVNGISIEMAAREQRYRRFGELCREQGFAAVLTAHNANDNAETLVINLLRGTGLRGMAGMASESILPCSDIRCRLVRPMLQFSREEIEWFLTLRHIPFRNDSSNSDVSYRRNRIRHNIFPEFKELNPSFIHTLNGEMKHFAQLRDVADSYYNDRRARVLYEESGKSLIDTEALRKESQWRYLLYRVMDEYGFSADSIDRLAGMLEDDSFVPGRTFVSPSHICITERGAISISVNSNTDDAEILVNKAGIYRFNGRSIRVSLNERRTEILAPASGIVCDADAVGLPFVIRGWKNGDFIAPLGMGGRRKKISDIFKDDRVSNSDRKGIALIAGLEDGRHILAIPEIRRIDEKVKVDDRTTVTITIELA